MNPQPIIFFSVPQLLFVLFINDLPDTIPTDINVALYADDTKAYNSVKSEDDAQHLQQALFFLDSWSTRNNLKFNESKCKVSSITRKKHPICFNYKLGSTDLLKVKEEKDLGVTVTDTLSWNPHIQNIVSKANKLLGLLKRTCPLLPDANVRRSLYLSIVKSQLSYATVVWSPHHIYLKLKIERVQRRATRWILKERLHESSYKERLIKLNMLPLCYDREIKDLIFFYNCLYGISPIDVNNFVGNCEEELPKKPVGRLSADSWPTGGRQSTDRLRKKKNCVKNEQLTWHNNP